MFSISHILSSVYHPQARPLLAAALLLLTFVTIPPAPCELDMDPSLSAVLNYAHQHQLQYGSDVVYTYGPWGFLIFFLFFPHAESARMAVDVGLCFAVAAGLCLVAWRLRPLWRWLLLGVFTWVVANIDARADLVINTGLLCWGLLCFVESGLPLVRDASIFTALAVFSGLAKVSFLFTGGASVLILACDILARGNRRLAMGIVAGFGAGLLFGWMLSGQSLLHFGEFLVNAFAVAQGYNQALGWEGTEMVRRSEFGLLPLVVAIVTIRTLSAFEGGDKRSEVGGRRSEAGERRSSDLRPLLSDRWRRGLLLAWATFLSFTAWKHGTVRVDAFHVVSFLGFATVLALALEVLPCEQPTARLWARGFGVACCLMSLVALHSLFFPSCLKSLCQPFRAFRYHARCLIRPAEYWRSMAETIEARRREAQLPEFRRIIGRASADVFGQRQAYAVFNDLDYRPRPVFQSYAACNRRLMRLNEEFYLSKAAPQYVLFQLVALDFKFPPLEDAWVLRDLLINYQPVSAEGLFLLFKAKAKSSEPPRLRLLRQGVVGPGKPIDLREYGDADLWLEIDLSPTVTGRLRQLLYRPPTVRLAAWREPARELLIRHRAPASMLAAGFLASPLLLRNEDVLNLYDRNGSVRPGAYSVELLRGEEHFWQEAIRFRIYKIENQMGRRAPRERAR